MGAGGGRPSGCPAARTRLSRRVLARRQGEVDSLRHLLAWCDLHSGAPQEQPDAVPVRHGGDRLVAVGGAGTPLVAQLCFAEFAVAARVGEIATTDRAADALDLRHRLPLVWAAVQELRIEVWVARRVASMSRRLTPEQVRVVDAAVALGRDLAAGKLLEVAEAALLGVHHSAPPSSRAATSPSPP